MHKLILAASILALALPAASRATVPVPVPTANYTFDGGATHPTTIGDGFGNHLTFHTGADLTGPDISPMSQAETGPRHSLLLDGDHDYIEGTDYVPAVDGDFSISLWAKSTGWGYSWQPLAFADDDAYNTYSWAVYGTTNDGGTVHAYVRMRDGASLDTIDLGGWPSTLSDGDWHQVALTVEGNTAKMYFDGTLADQATSTLTTGTVNPNAGHLFVGGDLYYENEKFDGTIDSLWYFDQTIDSDAVGELFDPFA